MQSPQKKATRLSHVAAQHFCVRACVHVFGFRGMPMGQEKGAMQLGQSGKKKESAFGRRLEKGAINQRYTCPSGCRETRP